MLVKILRIAGVVGEVVLTAGVLVLAYAGYLLWGTGIETRQAQEDLARRFAEQQRASVHQPAPADEAGIGEVYGAIRIPRFGADWRWMVVQGVRQVDLARGPGHYPNTADPGEVGNAAFAGHRSGHGQPFAHFDQLRRGDLIEIRTRAGAWRYRVDAPPKRITPEQTWVVDPVPGERRLTLTTCWPRYGSSHRLYVSALLAGGRDS